MPVFEDNAHGAKDKDVADQNDLADGRSRSFVDDDAQNFGAVKASAIADDKADADAEDGAADDNDLEGFARGTRSEENGGWPSRICKTKIVAKSMCQRNPLPIGR